jgi:hypothetical protein
LGGAEEGQEGLKKEDQVTRKDWWIGIAIILLALIIQTFILIRVGPGDDSGPRARPLSASYTVGLVANVD